MCICAFMCVYVVFTPPESKGAVRTNHLSPSPRLFVPLCFSPNENMLNTNNQGSFPPFPRQPLLSEASSCCDIHGESLCASNCLCLCLFITIGDAAPM